MHGILEPLKHGKCHTWEFIHLYSFILLFNECLSSTYYDPLQLAMETQEHTYVKVYCHLKSD